MSLSFRSPIPNPAKDCSCFTSSTWSVWSLFIAPTILEGCFPNDRYYKHFCTLVRILNLCLQFEISEKDIGNIELEICKWVVDYVQCVHPFCFQTNKELTWSVHLASTTSTNLNNFQHAHSQYMPSSTFLTKLDGWDHVGQHGPSQSRDNMGTFNAAFRVNKTHM